MTDFEVTDVETLVSIAHEAGFDVPLGIVNRYARRLDIDMSRRSTLGRCLEVGNSVQLSAHALLGVVVPAEDVFQLVGVCRTVRLQFHVLAIGVQFGNADVVA